MTDKPMEERQPEAGWAAEDEFDWRRYVVVLASWWREIAVITVAAALLAGLAVVALNRMSGPQYKAWVDVAIVRTASAVNFDERFTTTSAAAIGYTTDDVTARRNALLGLAQGPAIAEQVVGQIGDVLDAENRIPANLAGAVEAALVKGSGRFVDSDLIRITATADTPGKVARIATAWAETYVRTVNQIYGQAPDELLASIRDEQARAKAGYEKAQTALEEFTASNRSGELSRQITEKQGVIDQIVKARADVAAAYLGAETQTRAARFERWMQVTRALDQARTLRGQIAAGGPASTGGGALVIELLKLQALTQVLDQPAQANTAPLRIQLDANSAVSREELLADIDALVQALEQRRAELELQIAAPGEQLVIVDKSAYLGQAARGDNAPAQAQQAGLPGQPKTGADAVSAGTAPTATVGSDLLGSTVRGLEEEVRGLQAQHETENARYEQLVQERDLARDTLKTVSSKVAELAIARAAASSEVRLAAPAVPPARPETRGKVKPVVLGGMLGLFMGVFIALVASSFGMPPFFSRRQAKA